MTNIENSIEEQTALLNSPVITDEYSLKYAGFWIRFWAYTIDLIVLVAISGIFIKPIFRVFDWTISNPLFLFFSPYKVTMLIVALLYFMLLTRFLGQTIGKMIVGIRVHRKDGEKLTWGTIVFREGIGRFISKTLLLPYLLTVFMPKHEALHDLFADTVVMHENVYAKQTVQSKAPVVQSQQLQHSPNVQ